MARYCCSSPTDGAEQVLPFCATGLHDDTFEQVEDAVVARLLDHLQLNRR
jgi:hypothetical protein